MDESPAKLKPNFNNRLNAFKKPTEIKLVSNRITVKSDNDKQQAALGINTDDIPKTNTDAKINDENTSKFKPITIQSSLYIKGTTISHNLFN